MPPALKAKGARCVVLVSATLSPMSSFASELAIPFPVRLENPHVIAPDQVWGGVVPVGPSGKRLNSSYRFRDTDEYKAELGNAIVNFARVVPDGLLVFFPSYGVMRACVEFWRGHGTPSVWDRVCEEARGGGAAGQKGVRGGFRRVQRRARTGASEIRQRQRESSRKRRGTTRRRRWRRAAPRRRAFFAVCRGKVSEGIDFPASRARGDPDWDPVRAQSRREGAFERFPG